MEPGEAVAGAEASAPGPAGRPRRRQPKSELRRLMLETGREILQEEGIQTVSSNLTFKRVFDRVERDTGRRLSNASVIKRIWDNQADYQADVLVAVAHDERRPEVADTVAAVQEVLATVDLSTVEGRRAAMSELCRVAGAASRTALSDSTGWSLWVSTVTIATTTVNEDQRQRMRVALMEGYESVTEFWAGIYGGLVALLGLRLRAPRTLEQFAIAVSSLTEGDSFRQHVEGRTVTLDLPSGPGGELRTWTLYSVAIEALALQFFEPDPDFEAPAPTGTSIAG